MSDIKTGFTGELEDKTTMKAQVKRATSAVQREAGAVAATAQDHRAATGTALLLVGAVAFLAGYVLGAGDQRDSWHDRSWF
ncbi:hypothetical protein ASG25_11990 [Rhizobium sp. Leaf384]|uniref:hypothetical protein n=1 Tax=unclassified Rhizobium TaxID=2613769 RepID=UPI000714D1CE|nr:MULTISPECIES: hypothetical protein [unclassified Rhizobium]KQR68856.1 hypothetical protein ASG03_06295 [Rhizobium sp. Leaf341]KQS79270.1 hypothetical protein ASG25_11990 [Rhizobium sp. Leaf384]KQS82838.1 hypothetical protein ASG58_05805 [Rhizobium sp. Leaf383]